MVNAEALVPAGMSALKQLTLLDVTLCGNGLEDQLFMAGECLLWLVLHQD